MVSERSLAKGVVILAVLILAVGMASATQLRNIESISPVSGNEITIEGNISLNSQHWIKGVKDPASSSDLVTKSSADSDYLNRDGTDTMSGNLDMNSNAIVGGVNYIDFEDNLRINSDGAGHADFRDTTGGRTDIEVSRVYLGNNVGWFDGSGDQIQDNTIDSSEIQNGASFTFGGLTVNGDTTIDSEASTQLRLAGGNNGYSGLEIDIDDDSSNNPHSFRIRHEDGRNWDSNSVAFIVKPDENDHRVCVACTSPSGTVEINDNSGSSVSTLVLSGSPDADGSNGALDANGMVLGDNELDGSGSLHLQLNGGGQINMRTTVDMRGNSIVDDSDNEVLINDDARVSGQILMQDGSSGSPALTFNNDGDTGIYRVGGDDLGFAAQGFKLLEISSAGGIKSSADLNFESSNNIEDAGTDAIQFDGNQNVDIPNGHLHAQDSFRLPVGSDAW